MFNVLFIDDNFNEIRDVYFKIQEVGRCFYCDGENTPSEGHNFFFRKLEYICLDLRLDNVMSGNFVLNKSNYSLLINILKKFNPPSTAKIIINSAELKNFEISDFKRYLNSNYQSMEVLVEAKDKEKFTTLANYIKVVDETSRKYFLRNIIIETAIEIENLLWEKIKNKLITQISKKNLDSIFRGHFKNVNFYDKIILHDVFDELLTDDLHQLRKIRNDQAHYLKPLQLTEEQLFKLFDKLLAELSPPIKSPQ